MEPQKNNPKKRRYWRRTVKEKSCGVILFRTDENQVRQYLLLHYPGGHWDFAKGHVEERDASEQDTASRELDEETGIKDIQFFDGYREPMNYKFYRGKKEIVKKVVVYFLASTEDFDVKISHEHQGHTWLPFQEAMDQLTFDNARDLLQKAEDFLN